MKFRQANRTFFLLFSIIILGTFIGNQINNNYIYHQKKDDSIRNLDSIPEKMTIAKEIPKLSYYGDLYALMDRDTTEVIKQLGTPKRKDATPYGYQWWIYELNHLSYLQIGIEKEKVVSIFGVGNDLSIDPIKVGQEYSEIAAIYPLKENVSFATSNAGYRFHLTEEERKVRPLLQLNENLFIQLYFDKFTSKLSSVRLLSREVLLRHRPYEVYFSGQLPENPILTAETWNSIETGMEKQVFSITNIIRERYNKRRLVWDEQVAQVALGHSKDMAAENYFSHFSLSGRGLKERLSEGAIFYYSAGENIAAQYPDAPAAVEGWLNSEGHRRALLNNVYTHLGVGVYREYFTQNFLER